MRKSKFHRVFHGYGIAPGIAIGQAAIVEVGHFPRDIPRYSVAAPDVKREIQRFRMAVDAARADLDALVERVAEQVGEPEANILRGHSMMLQDPAFVSQVEDFVVKHKVNVEVAVSEVMGKFRQLFELMDDEYLRERAADVRDVERRLLSKLLFVDGDVDVKLDEPRVVVSEHLVPSLTVHLEREHVLGFATEKGGATSHAAILARSAGIPAVSGLEGLAASVVQSQTVVVDGIEGKVIIDPTKGELKHYRELAARFQSDRDRVMTCSREPVVTTDGVQVRVLANVGRPGDVAAAMEYDAHGIGLYRTEFEFMSQSSIPSEDLLTGLYTQAVEKMAGAPVTIRVLDIGGDKFPPAFPLAHEENPYLGYRGIRVLLGHVDDLLLPHLRAILRASAHGPTRVMYPMVSGLAEFRAAAAQFERAKAQLAKEGVAFDPHMQQGVMIEVPALVAVLEDLLQEADFGSVGTNDLVQYILAADRNNDRMVGYYDPLHPAVIRNLAMIASAARRANKEVSVCGEVAGDPLYVPLLVGLGFRSLSASPGAIPFVKDCIRHVSMAECERLASQTLEAKTVDEIRECVAVHRQTWREKATP